MMKKQLLTLVLLAFGVCCAYAQSIEVNGLQSGVWEADTVFVMGDVIIQDSLCIQAGTTVFFKGHFGIKAEKGAFIKAIGSEVDSITFTVGDTTGFHIFNFGRGGWNGIRLEHAGASKFDFCRFQYGKAARDDDQDGGALRIFGCDDVEISHSTLFCNFSREHGGALNAEWSKVAIHDCDVCNNLTYTGLDTVYFMYGGGLRFINCDVELTKTDFRYNNGHSAIGGALSLDSCAVKLDRCKFEHNYGINGGGLYLIRCNDWDCSITNSLFANNISGHFGGGLAISDSSPLVSNLTVVGNQSIGVNCGGIFFYQCSRPELWNCIIYGNQNAIPIETPVQMWAWTYDEYAPEFHNCLVQFGLDNISGNENILVYEDCLDDDPLFVDPENEEFRISGNSPCYNTGSPDSPASILEGYDLAGNPRVLDGSIDIGAYEFDITLIPETAQKEQFIQIVGNPITSSSYAEIELDKDCILFAKVYSIDGKLLIEKPLGKGLSGRNRIEIGEWLQPLTQGSYILVIHGGERYLVAKVIR